MDCRRFSYPTALHFGSHLKPYLNTINVFSLECCGRRIVISPKIPGDSPSCYHSSIGNLAVLFFHFIATLARLLGPDGVRSLVAESLLLKHQLLIVNRSTFLIALVRLARGDSAISA
jgi:hypothetical protein